MAGGSSKRGRPTRCSPGRKATGCSSSCAPSSIARRSNPPKDSRGSIDKGLQEPRAVTAANRYDRSTDSGSELLNRGLRKPPAGKGGAAKPGTTRLLTVKPPAKPTGGRATLRDVAEAAGVSPMTVSNLVNGRL